MGLTNRKKSDYGFNGSKLIVPGLGISTVKLGGNNRINEQKPNTDININKIKRT
jgi:hypothetical protein